MIKFYEFILTFLYVGKIRKAPGTFGSIAGVIFWLLLALLFFIGDVAPLIQNIFWLAFIVFFTIFGAKFCESWAKFHNNSDIDHQSIVLDEVVGQIIALQMVFVVIFDYEIAFDDKFCLFLALSLVLFRFFDIKKPSFIGYIDRNVKNGIGVFLDDLVSGIAAGLVAIVLMMIF